MINYHEHGDHVIQDVACVAGGSPFAPSAPIFGGPFNALGINPDLPLDHGLVVFLDCLLREADNILAPVILD